MVIKDLLSPTDLERIKLMSQAISADDRDRLRSLSDRPLPNEDIFWEYIHYFRDKVVPLLDGFEDNIVIGELPDGTTTLDVPMRTREGGNTIFLLLTKTESELNIEAIYDTALGTY